MAGRLRIHSKAPRATEATAGAGHRGHGALAGPALPSDLRQRLLAASHQAHRHGDADAHDPERHTAQGPPVVARPSRPPPLAPSLLSSAPLAPSLLSFALRLPRTFGHGSDHSRDVSLTPQRHPGMKTKARTPTF